ncbi:two-component system, OmpR family, response regulator BasR [Thorsellia anophelis DSM 18579]|uniref:Two-component system, OmpR family, response regulator BasR n=1 Tax=Thorsellia anophelis DSM 18579 TaxID=1123402 RepID=A0A1I0F595_9GAMM|nr:two-component system, OmpR family, response regulator BasR [Thorsellia anophelis DSM 18579]
MPDGSGIDALKKLRASGINLPVLIVTARDRLDDKVIGLDAGADDYLIKPFELKELFARVRALFRRSEGQSSNVIRHKNFNLDVSKRLLLMNDTTINLTMREFAIFHRLILRAGEIVSRQQLLSDMYAWNDEFGSNTLEVYIHNLRGKLGKHSIVTIRGQGYRLE